MIKKLTWDCSAIKHDQGVNLNLLFSKAHSASGFAFSIEPYLLVVLKQVSKLLVVNTLANRDKPKYFAMGLEVPPLVVLHRVASLVAHCHVAVLALNMHYSQSADPLQHAVEDAGGQVRACVTNQNQQRLMIFGRLTVINHAHPDVARDGIKKSYYLLSPW